MSVLAGHVRNTTDLAFAPEKLVIVEGGHLVQVDRVDGDDAALAEAGKGADHDRPAGSEGDRAIEFDGRVVVFSSDPGCAGGDGLITVGFAASGDIDLALPVTEDVDG